MKYIDAERLSVEIDRRMTDNLKADSEIHSTAYFAGAAKEDYDILSIIDSLQQEQKEQPTRGYDEAYLNEKIAKATKSWKGVDVDKFMDEVRGREPETDLEKELNSLDDAYFDLDGIAVKGATYYLTVEDLKDIARHFYELGKNSK